jgi:hypothetical protein
MSLNLLIVTLFITLSIAQAGRIQFFSRNFPGNPNSIIAAKDTNIALAFGSYRVAKAFRSRIESSISSTRRVAIHGEGDSAARVYEPDAFIVSALV